jgi:hypothetical protein
MVLAMPSPAWHASTPATLGTDAPPGSQQKEADVVGLVGWVLVVIIVIVVLAVIGLLSLIRRG